MSDSSAYASADDATNNPVSDSVADSSLNPSVDTSAQSNYAMANNSYDNSQYSYQNNVTMNAVPGAFGEPNAMPGVNNMVQRPSSRRRPRFVPRPKNDDNASFVERRNLLTSVATSAKHQITRERKIAGNLPDWDPLPPGEILINR